MPAPTAPARRSAMIARVATAPPMLAVVNGLPVGESTPAPAFRQRSARRMSPVTTMLCGPLAAAIQSSAASKPSPTTTRAISGWSGTRRWLLATIVTGTPWRQATL